MLLAILLSLLAALAWGASAIFVRLGLRHMRSTTGTVVSLAAGVLFVGLLTFALYRFEMFALPASVYAWIILLGIINYPLGRLLNFKGVQLAGVGRTAPILAGAPVVAATLGVALGGETITSPIALGIAAIVAGVVLVVSERTS
ncbi:MAG: GRP family sugar transporter [Dehalococcoidia bacterium]|nr:GRP family sugar transporter [Dehalococcoidia bacterium]